MSGYGESVSTVAERTSRRGSGDRCTVATNQSNPSLAELDQNSALRIRYCFKMWECVLNDKRSKPAEHLPSHVYCSRELPG
jgi:hypothetical protein